MSVHSERAQELFLRGYNCSQAVFAAFCDKMDIDEETALRLSAGFGGGIARQRETCGTLLGATMVISYLFGPYDGGDYQSKNELYERVRAFFEAFREAQGAKSTICRDLLGAHLIVGAEVGGYSPPRDADFYRKRPCLRIITSTAEMLDAFIERV